MRCNNCGTEFSEGIFCPNCGAKNAASEDTIIHDNCSNDNSNVKGNSEGKKNSKVRKQKENSRAIWSLILGLVSWLGIVTVILPVICGSISIVKGIQALKAKTKYKKCAVVGIILSVLVYVLIIYLVLAPSPSNNVSLSENNKIVEEETAEESKGDENQVDLVEKDKANNQEINTDEYSSTDELSEEDNVEKDLIENEPIEEDEAVEKKLQEQIAADEEEYVAVTIDINYVKKGFAYNDDGIIYVDGDEIGNINAGNEQYFTVYLTKGTHKIQVKSDTLIRANNTKKLKFTVDDDNTYFLFTLKEKAMGLNLKQEK